jgi:hypothetical protein
MGHRLLGRLHATLPAPGRERGQGTVEYVALILLVAVVLAGVIAATRHSSIGGGQIAETIVKQLKGALEHVR